jgi:hypothetical protein
MRKITVSTAFLIKKIDTSGDAEPRITVVTWACSARGTGYAIKPFEREIFVGDTIKITHNLEIEET